MKKLLPLILLLCLMLTACTRAEEKPDETPAPVEPTVEDPVDTKDPPDAQEEDDGPMLLDKLAVELVVDVSETESVMGSLRQFSADLTDALKEKNIDVETVSFTMSTAGGVTGDALSVGGIDMAFLPVMDFIARRDALTPLLMVGDTEDAYVAALTTKNDALKNADLQKALSEALTDTEAGRQFLAAWSPEAEYGPVSQEVLDPLVEQYLKAQEEAAQH